MRTIKFSPVLILQFFADGGDGGAGGAEMGVSQSPAGNKGGLDAVVYGRQAEAQIPAEQETETVQPEKDRATRWKDLIKGEFKDEYGKAVKDAVDKRFRGNQELLDRANAQAPLIDRLASRYGVDPSDINGLMAAWDADDALYEAEAMDKGLTIDQLKSMKKVEMENASLRRQMEEKKAQEGSQQIYSKWIADGEAVKALYPDFDLNAELTNQNFSQMLMAGVDMKSAYEVAHLNELVPSAMQFAAKQAEEKISKSVSANRSRPVENGMRSASAAQVKSDPSKLTFADLAEIERRVARGEKISF